MTIPDGFGQWSLIFEGGGVEGEAVTTLGFRNDAGASAAVCADVMATEAVNFVDQFCSNLMTLTSVNVKLGPDETGAIHEEPTAIIGDQGNDNVNPQVAVLLRKTTNLGGRRGRGRMFIPGPPDVMTSATGLWDGAAITQWQTAADLLLDNLTTAELVPVLLHSGATAPSPLTGLLVVARSGSQRRRNRR